MADTAAVVERLPLLTRVQVMEEGERDPRFWSYFASLVNAYDPARVVDDEMTRVLINELEPRRFAETSGRWPMLRAHLRRTIAIARDGARRGMGGLMEDGFGGGLAQWEAIASVVSAVSSVAGASYSTYMQKRLADAKAAAEKRAQEQQAAQLRAQQEAAAKAATAQQAAARQAAGTPGFPGYGVAGTGWPSWATYAIIAVLGAVGVTVAVKVSRR